MESRQILYKQGCKKEDECSQGLCIGSQYKWEKTGFMEIDD